MPYGIVVYRIRIAWHGILYSILAPPASPNGLDASTACCVERCSRRSTEPMTSDPIIITCWLVRLFLLCLAAFPWTDSACVPDLL